jgi:hypothetical protein
MRAAAAALFAVCLASPAHTAEVPSTAFYSGNDVYDWCRNDRRAAFSFVAGLYDSAAHAAAVIDSGRHFGKDMPNNDVEIDFALNRVVGYCKPERATLEQVTDVFCAYLADKPAERDGLPAIMFPKALTKAWPCPKK